VITNVCTLKRCICYVYIYIYNIHILICICTCACICTFMMYICTYMYMHVYLHAYTHTYHKQIFSTFTCILHYTGHDSLAHFSASHIHPRFPYTYPKPQTLKLSTLYICTPIQAMPHRHKLAHHTYISHINTHTLYPQLSTLKPCVYVHLFRP